MHLTPPPPPPPPLYFLLLPGEGEGEIMGEGLSRVGESSINPCSSFSPAPPRAAPRRPAPPRAAPRRPAPPRAVRPRPRRPSQTAPSVGGGRALYKQRREVGRVPRVPTGYASRERQEEHTREHCVCSLLKLCMGETPTMCLR